MVGRSHTPTQVRDTPSQRVRSAKENFALPWRSAIKAFRPSAPPRSVRTARALRSHCAGSVGMVCLRRVGVWDFFCFSRKVPQSQVQVISTRLAGFRAILSKDFSEFGQAPLRRRYRYSDGVAVPVNCRKVPCSPTSRSDLNTPPAPQVTAHQRSSGGNAGGSTGDCDAESRATGAFHARADCESAKVAEESCAEAAQSTFN